MLMITLPVADHATGQPEMSGHCRINGKAAEFRIDESDGTFNYRHEGGEWQKRWIKDGGYDAGKDVVTLLCGERPEQYIERDGHVAILKG
jgi:hypothetical protein